METSTVFGINFLNDISEMTEYIFRCMAMVWGGTDRVTWSSVQQEEARQGADGC